jgi:hypothetical protein
MLKNCIFHAVSQTTKVLIEVSILSHTTDRVGHRDGFITEYVKNYIYEHMRGDMEVSATPIFFLLKNIYFIYK